jgi:hypothetical protein
VLESRRNAPGSISIDHFRRAVSMVWTTPLAMALKNFIYRHSMCGEERARHLRGAAIDPQDSTDQQKKPRLARKRGKLIRAA